MFVFCVDLVAFKMGVKIIIPIHFRPRRPVRKCIKLCMPYTGFMTDIAKKLKNASQDAEAKLKTEEDHANGKPGSENLNKAKVKAGDTLT